MKKFDNPYEYSEYINDLAGKYQDLIEVIDVKDVQQIQGVDFLNQYSAWVNDYLGSSSIEKIEELYDQIIESDELKLVIKTINNVFKKIYIVTNDIIEKREHQFHLKENIKISEDVLLNNYNIIAILQPDIFGSLESDIFCINEFLNTQKEILKNHKEREIIDPLGYLEKQKEIDEYTEKVKNDEITISEMLKHFGYSFDDDLDENKIKKLVNDLVNGNITSEEFKAKVAAGEITLTEISIIDAQLKLAYPEVYKKLNN